MHGTNERDRGEYTVLAVCHARDVQELKGTVDLVCNMVNTDQGQVCALIDTRA